ncbi:MAG: NAD(P)/FAD-dependent oxidoreductase [Neoaquamicrobium sediminum]|uniref:NAD(P)/FAD-dependent oxidoreductase n=1 Tax=Neoaquamicrobium sediminum TaxID=1849104 RepID=UPI0040356014
MEIACRMRDRQTLYLAGNVLTGSKLRDEAELRASAGLPAHYLTVGELARQLGIDRDGAIFSTGNFVVDPVKLTKGLLLQAQARGAQLFAPEEASKFKFHKSSIEMTMRSGHRIEAGHVVLATGYELMDVVQTDRHDIISTWAIATKRQPKGRLWPGEAMIWEASDPYLYLRTTHDGRIICGGEDEDFQDEQSRDRLIAKKTQRIVDKLRKLLPDIDPTPEFAWAGSFGTTPTGLPLIGPVPRRPRLFSLMGYGGNGITYARIAAEVVRNKLAGREDSDADLFAL